MEDLTQPNNTWRISRNARDWTRAVGVPRRVYVVKLRWYTGRKNAGREDSKDVVGVKSFLVVVQGRFDNQELSFEEVVGVRTAATEDEFPSRLKTWMRVRSRTYVQPSVDKAL